MPKKKNTAKAVAVRKEPKCVCVVMHTYDAFVTADAWNVSVHVCAVCGVEHRREVIPEPGDKDAVIKIDG